MSKSLPAFKNAIKNLAQEIPTNEFYKGKRVFWIPIHKIVQWGGRKRDLGLLHYLLPSKDRARFKKTTDYGPYNHYRFLGKNRASPGDTRGTHAEVINGMRRSLRQGKQLKPVSVWPQENDFSKYDLIGGNHRFVAHKAEGKRYIKAIIQSHETTDE